MQIEPVPYAYTMRQFICSLPRVRRRLRALICRARYLQFAVCGLIGDWGGVAASVARAMGREYAVHLESVEYELVRRAAADKPWPRRMWNRALAAAMRRRHRTLVRGARLALCHGNDCMVAYGPYNANAHLIHDIHVSMAELVGDTELDRKLGDRRGDPRLRIVYAGRMIWLKGPGQWLDTVERLVQAGVVLQAVWLGDGDLLSEMRQQVQARRLRAHVELRGFVADRQAVLREIEAADLFMFTHLTPESPRCLIEALMVGTPIVGYASDYASELIHAHAGGVLTPQADPGALAAAVQKLAADRPTIETLSRAAALDGQRFTREAVFEHRSNLIKQYLQGGAAEMDQPAYRPSAIGRR